MLPDDLHHWRASNGFMLFTESEALILLGIVLAGALLVDALQRWFG